MNPKMHSVEVNVWETTSGGGAAVKNPANPFQPILQSSKNLKDTHFWGHIKKTFDMYRNVFYVHAFRSLPTWFSTGD
jgi:hypothetical protein